MITTCNTQQRIINAMEKGAKLYLHFDEDGDGGVYISHVTLERNDRVFTLSTFYRHDETYWDDRHDSQRLRCGEYSRPTSAGDIAIGMVHGKHPDIRNEYAGYRSEYRGPWRELYVHNNHPVPRWVTEQWGSEQW